MDETYLETRAPAISATWSHYVLAATIPPADVSFAVDADAPVESRFTTRRCGVWAQARNHVSAAPVVVNGEGEPYLNRWEGKDSNRPSGGVYWLQALASDWARRLGGAQAFPKSRSAAPPRWRSTVAHLRQVKQLGHPDIFTGEITLRSMKTLRLGAEANMNISAAGRLRHQ